MSPLQDTQYGPSAVPRGVHWNVRCTKSDCRCRAQHLFSRVLNFFVLQKKSKKIEFCLYLFTLLINNIMATEPFTSIITLVLLILYTLWCVLLYLIQGAFFILTRLYRYLVYVYQALCLLYLQWGIMPYLKNVPIQDFMSLWVLEEGDKDCLPPDIRHWHEEVIERCTKNTNASYHTIIQFLSRDIGIRKLMHLMNCSCECRSTRRINPISHKLTTCGCCFRHDDHIPILCTCCAVICIAFCIIVI
jgi:hypothetical protein